MDSSEPKSTESTGVPDERPGHSGAGTAAAVLGGGVSSLEGRRIPGRAHSIRILAWADLRSVWRSWLCRGFLVLSALLSVLALKGMQAEQKAASQMLEAVYVTYLLIWMHGVIFIAGAALSREQDCLNDAILSRGITRGEYLSSKLVARCLAILLMIGVVLVPCSFWAVRQDQLVRREGGYVTSHARDTRVEAWDPKKVFAGADGTIAEMPVEVGDEVQAGDLLVLLDDRALFDQLETERRGEENARNDLNNARRAYEDVQRAVAQAEDALARAERALIAKDLLSKIEQADRETDVRARKRDLQNAQNQLRIAADAIVAAERPVENAAARVREARKRLGYATLTAPVSGYVIELHVEATQHVGLGTHLLTLSRLDEFQVKVPVYRFDEFRRLRKGLKAFVKVGDKEYTGEIDRLGATTEQDRWGRTCNSAVVRFRGDGTLGLLGQNADVRLSLPPPEGKKTTAAAILNALTGGADDVESRTASVTPFWMLVGLGKVLGCAALLVALTILLLCISRSALIAILGAIGLWHVSNLLFDFAGLPDLSYLEMVRTMDRVLSGIANPTHELVNLAWLFGLAVLFAVLSLAAFISRDPAK